MRIKTVAVITAMGLVTGVLAVGGAQAQAYGSYGSSTTIYRADNPAQDRVLMPNAYVSGVSAPSDYRLRVDSTASRESFYSSRIRSAYLRARKHWSDGNADAACEAIRDAIALEQEVMRGRSKSAFSARESEYCAGVRG